jgi:hypothetical protein
MKVYVVAEAKVIPPIIVITAFPRTTALKPGSVGIFNSLARTFFSESL